MKRFHSGTNSGSDTFKDISPISKKRRHRGQSAEFPPVATEAKGADPRTQTAFWTTAPKALRILVMHRQNRAFHARQSRLCLIEHEKHWRVETDVWEEEEGRRGFAARRLVVKSLSDEQNELQTTNFSSSLSQEKVAVSL